MRDNQPQCVVVNNRQYQFDLFSDPALEVSSVFPMNEETEYVTYRRTENDLSITFPVTSVAVAAYTTSLARVELYKRLDFLGERVLYFDTDSCVYTHKEGEEMLPTGDFLGEMTNELDDFGPGSYISCFDEWCTQELLLSCLLWR